MDTFLAFLLLAAACTALYQTYVSVRLWISGDYTTKQKLAQLVLIWLVPLLGANIVHWFLSHGASDSGTEQKDSDFITQDRNAQVPGSGRW
jgi:hypothetical protein